MEDEKLTVEQLEKKLSEVVGITPLELYMRQNGLCYLELKDDEVYCTDGEDSARTDWLANPTIECSRCLSNFILFNCKRDADK